MVKYCKCGCGDIVKNEWSKGHYSRVHNNWGHNKTAIENSANTRREQFKNGERKVWNDGLTAETDKRVKENCKNLVTWNKSEQASDVKSFNMKSQWESGNLKVLYGKESSQWQGGTSPLSARVYASNKLYKEWKYPILKKAGFKCNECGSSKELHVHHDKEMMNEILKKFTGKSNPVKKVVDYHVRNKVSGVVLCYTHHKEQHPSLNF